MERNKENVEHFQIANFQEIANVDESKLKEEKNVLLSKEIQQLSQITTELRESNEELTKLLQSSPQEILCILEQLKKHHSEQEEYKINIRILTGVIEEKQKKLTEVTEKMEQLETIFNTSMVDCYGDENRIYTTPDAKNDLYIRTLEFENKVLKLQFSNANYKLKELKGKKKDATTLLARIRTEKEILLREIEQFQVEVKKLKDENRVLRLKIENHKESCPLSEKKNIQQNSKSPRDFSRSPVLQEVRSPWNSKKLASMEEISPQPTKKKSRQKSTSTSTPKRISDLTRSKCSLQNPKGTVRHKDQENSTPLKANQAEEVDQFLNGLKNFVLDLPTPPMEELSSLL